MWGFARLKCGRSVKMPTRQVNPFLQQQGDWFELHSPRLAAQIPDRETFCISSWKQPSKSPMIASLAQHRRQLFALNAATPTWDAMESGHRSRTRLLILRTRGLKFGLIILALLGVELGGEGEHASNSLAAPRVRCTLSCRFVCRFRVETWPLWSREDNNVLLQESRCAAGA